MQGIFTILLKSRKPPPTTVAAQKIAKIATVIKIMLIIFSTVFFFISIFLFLKCFFGTVRTVPCCDAVDS